MKLIVRQRRELYLALVLTTLSFIAVALAMLSAASMPWWTFAALQTLAMMSKVYLLGIGSGIITSLFAVRSSLEYFSKGDFCDGKVIESDNHFANWFASGMVNFHPYAALTAVVFGGVASFPDFLSPTLFPLLAPVLVVGAVSVLLGAEVYAQLRRYLCLKNEAYAKSINAELADNAEENIQAVQQQANWKSCDDRLNFASAGMTFLAVGSLFAGIILHSELSTNHAHFIWAAFNLALPLQVALIATPFVLFTLSVLYLFKHDSQSASVAGSKTTMVSAQNSDRLRTESSASFENKDMVAPNLSAEAVASRNAQAETFTHLSFLKEIEKSTSSEALARVITA